MVTGFSEKIPKKAVWFYINIFFRSGSILSKGFEKSGKKV